MVQGVKRIRGTVFTSVILLLVYTNTGCSEEDIPEVISDHDIEFVAEAGKRLEEIIRMGNLAAHRSEHPAVRSFARSKISVLRSSRLDLRGLAYLYEIPYPTEPRAQVQEAYQTLAGLYGYEFDSTYIHQQVMAQREAKELFHLYVNNSSHERIRSFALLQLSDFVSKLEGAQMLHDSLYKW